MTSTNVLHRPAALALCLLVLATTGCAHFHDAEVRAQERAEAQTGVQRTEPPLAQAAPPPPVVPEPPTPPPPAPAPSPPAHAPTALETAPPAPPSAPEAAPQAAPAPPVASAAPAEPVPSVTPPPAPNIAREAAPEAPVALPAPPIAAPPAAASPATAPAPATGDAIIIFANTPVAHCGACETLKISVAPSGQVLMERGSWTAGHGTWRYKRSRAEVSSERVAAFAASLSADRPVGARTLGNGGCASPVSGDAGLSIEWIEADRDDRLTVNYGCPASGGDQVAERLRHAPDLLGLRQLALP